MRNQFNRKQSKFLKDLGFRVYKKKATKPHVDGDKRIVVEIITDTYGYDPKGRVIDRFLEARIDGIGKDKYRGNGSGTSFESMTSSMKEAIKMLEEDKETKRKNCKKWEKEYKEEVKHSAQLKKKKKKKRTKDTLSVNELIKELEKIKKKHGNIAIFSYTLDHGPFNCGCDFVPIEEAENEETHLGIFPYG